MKAADYNVEVGVASLLLLLNFPSSLIHRKSSHRVLVLAAKPNNVVALHQAGLEIYFANQGSAVGKVRTCHDSVAAKVPVQRQCSFVSVRCLPSW